MDVTDEIVRFFGEVNKIISKYGIETVLKNLRQLHGEFDDELERDVSEYILAVTSNHYEVEIDDIRYSNKRGVISESRRMCFALMKEHLPISDEEIGGIFGGRSRQYVSKERNSLPINQDKFATKDEAKFVNDFLELTMKVLYFKNEYKLNKRKKPN